MINVILWALTLFVAITTALPLTNSVRWWIRMWDFPRLHLAALALFIILLAVPFSIAFKPVLILIALISAAYQIFRIFPYMPLARPEVKVVETSPETLTVSLLAANVLMENARHGDLIALIEREDPDVVFLMETDRVWHDALLAGLERYSTIKTHLSDNHYGLIFATRLKAREVDLKWPSDDDTPALKAILADSEGREFNFIGLHPRPPVPGNDTATRDRQIKNAALMTSSADRPTICMGDFNDAAWSWTTRRFKKYGNFLEPRVGRGLISSFHAQYSFIRLPIDQLFVTKDVGLVAFERLEEFGSDHFPIIATVTFDQTTLG
ncbi:endonuclease/exonuclease/phosphatase family protein [Oceaniglobus ichthyenteri]|uniref:endonuclease/exonuclease/phosphatase family protein n=1 Tax=Oceaniglobus ichthyenteri TaxID=2136177 RepID=UPI000D3AF096|nr:endonuclease/exonuclease/phosphatase family protein [Oceaniglobus ichthyenteri]